MRYNAQKTGNRAIHPTVLFSMEYKDFDDSKREFSGIATSSKEDRYGDIVEPEGAQYQLPIPLLWQHDSHSPVGHVLEATTTKKNIKVKMKLAQTDVPGLLKDMLDKAWQSLKLGLVSNLSIGFNPIEYEAIPDSQRYGLRFLTWEWLELSLVTIPANADATVLSIKSTDRKQLWTASGQHQRKFSGVPLVKVDASGVSGKGIEGTRQRKAVQLVKP